MKDCYSKTEVLQELYKLRHKISRNVYRTILGQINAGEINAARVGISRLKSKI